MIEWTSSGLTMPSRFIPTEDLKPPCLFSLLSNREVIERLKERSLSHALRRPRCREALRTLFGLQEPDLLGGHLPYPRLGILAEHLLEYPEGLFVIPLAVAVDHPYVEEAAQVVR